MKKKLLVLCCLSVLSVPACEPFSETNQGFLFASVKFPTGGFKIKAIPVNTAAIEVQVSGNGIANPIKFSLSPNEPTITIKKIPTGNKEINVIAKDTVGKSLATGNGSIDVKENTLNRVEITLNPLPEESPSPTPTPSQTSSPDTGKSGPQGVLIN